MARIWTKLHEHLGSSPGPLTFDMVRQAAESNLQESDDLDWKERLPQPPRDGQWNEFAKDIAAMANTRGGLLVFGVKDKTTELMGVEPEGVNLQQYAQWVRNHVQPYLPDLDMFTLGDGVKTVLIIDVPASEMAPHFVYGTSAKNKEQQAAVVPYRDKDHTAWMAEHQIERAYRDRFARAGRAEDEMQQHFNLVSKNIAAHATAPAAWLIAVSRPHRPLPHGAPSPSRDEAREILRAAEVRARTLGRIVMPGPLGGMGSNTLLNPRPGLRRWVCSTLELSFNREIVVELHYDGTVLVATNLSWLRPLTEPPGEEDELVVSDRLVTACCCDLVATVQELQRKLRLDSTQQITVAIASADKPRAMVPSIPTFLDGYESTPDHARHPHFIQPVHAILSPAAGEDEGRAVVEELRADLMSQFGV